MQRCGETASAEEDTTRTQVVVGGPKLRTFINHDQSTAYFSGAPSGPQGPLAEVPRKPATSEGSAREAKSGCDFEGREINFWHYKQTGIKSRPIKLLKHPIENIERKIIFTYLLSFLFKLLASLTGPLIALLAYLILVPFKMARKFVWLLLNLCLDARICTVEFAEADADLDNSTGSSSDSSDIQRQTFSDKQVNWNYCPLTFLETYWFKEKLINNVILVVDTSLESDGASSFSIAKLRAIVRSNILNQIRHRKFLSCIVSRGLPFYKAHYWRYLGLRPGCENVCDQGGDELDILQADSSSNSSTSSQSINLTIEPGAEECQRGSGRGEPEVDLNEHIYLDENFFAMLSKRNEKSSAIKPQALIRKYAFKLLRVKLNLARPLWEIRVIPMRGKTFLIFRCHQCLADGSSLIKLLTDHLVEAGQQQLVEQVTGVSSGKTNESAQVEEDETKLELIREKKSFVSRMSKSDSFKSSILVGPLTILIWIIWTFTRRKNNHLNKCIEIKERRGIAECLFSSASFFKQSQVNKRTAHEENDNFSTKLAARNFVRNNNNSNDDCRRFYMSDYDLTKFYQIKQMTRSTMSDVILCALSGALRDYLRKFNGISNPPNLNVSLTVDMRQTSAAKQNHHPRQVNQPPPPPAAASGSNDCKSFCGPEVGNNEDKSAPRNNKFVEHHERISDDQTDVARRASNSISDNIMKNDHDFLLFKTADHDHDNNRQRKQAQQHQLRSQVNCTLVNVPLPTSVEGTVPRLWELRTMMEELRNSADPWVMLNLQRFLFHLLPTSWYQTLVNYIALRNSSMFVSNIRGPKNMVESWCVDLLQRAIFEAQQAPKQMQQQTQPQPQVTGVELGAAANCCKRRQRDRASRLKLREGLGSLGAIYYCMQPPTSEVPISFNCITYHNRLFVTSLSRSLLVEDSRLLVKLFFGQLDQLASSIAKRKNFVTIIRSPGPKEALEIGCLQEGPRSRPTNSGAALHNGPDNGPGISMKVRSTGQTLEQQVVGATCCELANDDDDNRTGDDSMAAIIKMGQRDKSDDNSDDTSESDHFEDDNNGPSIGRNKLGPDNSASQRDIIENFERLNLSGRGTSNGSAEVGLGPSKGAQKFNIVELRNSPAVDVEAAPMGSPELGAENRASREKSSKTCQCSVVCNCRRRRKSLLNLQDNSWSQQQPRAQNLLGLLHPGRYIQSSGFLNRNQVNANERLIQLSECLCGQRLLEELDRDVYCVGGDLSLANYSLGLSTAQTGSSDLGARAEVAPSTTSRPICSKCRQARPRSTLSLNVHNSEMNQQESSNSRHWLEKFQFNQKRKARSQNEVAFCDKRPSGSGPREAPNQLLANCEGSNQVNSIEFEQGRRKQRRAHSNVRNYSRSETDLLPMNCGGREPRTDQDGFGQMSGRGAKAFASSAASQFDNSPNNKEQTLTILTSHRGVGADKKSAANEHSPSQPPSASPYASFIRKLPSKRRQSVATSTGTSSSASLHRSSIIVKDEINADVNLRHHLDSTFLGFKNRRLSTIGSAVVTGGQRRSSLIPFGLINNQSFPKLLWDDGEAHL